MFKKPVIGIIVFIIFVILGITLKIIIKKNMNNVIKIETEGIRSPASIYFKNKMTTLLLSPLSNGILLVIILLLCIGLIFFNRNMS
jgi:hypothetical protein